VDLGKSTVTTNREKVLKCTRNLPEQSVTSNRHDIDGETRTDIMKIW